VKQDTGHLPIDAGDLAKSSVFFNCNCSLRQQLTSPFIENDNSLYSPE